MIVVIDLLKNIFIFMFIILISIEVIVLICLTTLYRVPLENNVPAVEDASIYNAQEVLHSFNSILLRKYINTQTDLIAIAKHIYAMQQTLTTGPKDNYARFNMNSMFFNSLTDCIITNSTLFSNYTEILNYENYTDYLFHKYDDFKGYSEDDILASLLSQDSLNKVLAFPDQNITEIENYKNLEKYVCFAKIILKTLYTRNLMLERKKPITQLFSLYIKEKYFFTYPIRYHDNKFSDMIYNDFNRIDCSYNVKQQVLVNDPSLLNCFKTFHSFSDQMDHELKAKTNPYNLTKDIYFDVPKDMQSRGCIRIRYFEDEDKVSNFACIDFDLKGLFDGLEINPDVIQIFLVTDDSRTQGKNDLNLIYWSKMYNNIIKRNPTDEDTIIIDPDIDFSRPAFNTVGLSPDSLYNGIYYNLLDQVASGNLNKTKDSLLQALMSEYNSTMYSVKQAMAMHNETVCENYTYINSNITTQMTYGNLYYNIVTKKVGNKILYLDNFKIDFDKFQFIVYPVRLNITSYKEGLYIFDSECSSRVLFYSIAMVKVGVI
jgi:hypothetical protein